MSPFMQLHGLLIKLHAYYIRLYLFLSSLSVAQSKVKVIYYFSCTNECITIPDWYPFVPREAYDEWDEGVVAHLAHHHHHKNSTKRVELSN